MKVLLEKSSANQRFTEDFECFFVVDRGLTEALTP